MHYPKLLQHKGFRFAFASLALVFGSACSERATTTAPQLASAPGVSRESAVAGNRYFVAWSRNYSTGQIPTQIFGLDVRQDRQFVDWYVDQATLAFARANPGRLYIDGDEPDQYCTTPWDYAGMYRDFVVAIKGADPTARVSPAGFAEPNPHCCPGYPDVPCSEVHGLAYANNFYSAYVTRYGVAPIVDEWRFHDFGVKYDAGDLNGWWQRIDAEATWSVNHGANMYLGGWGFHGWPAKESTALFQEHLKQAMGRLLNDKRINGAAYWSYERWIESPRPLLNDDGSLSPEGQTYANPLSDVPANLNLVASNGTAKLKWSNTTAAWGAEVEFWVQAPGASSFVYRSTEFVPQAAGIQSRAVSFNSGENVRARVRYYNPVGQGGWSGFSNTVALSRATSDAAGKRPLFCALQLC